MAKRKAKRSQVVRTYSLDELETLEGPTDQRRQRGAWTRHKSKDRTEIHERDMRSNPIDALEHDGVITPEQAQAGRDYEALMARTRLVGEGRSCLNFEPVGYGDSDHDDADAWRSIRDLERKLGLFKASLLRRIIKRWDYRASNPHAGAAERWLLGIERAHIGAALDICETHFSGGRR